MKTNSRFLFTVALGLAMALTFGCSSNSDVSQLANSSKGEDYSSSVHSDNSSSSSNNENNGSSSSSANSGYNSSSSVQSSSSVSEGCEDIIFNPLTSFCYENNVYSKCNGMVFNPTTHICQGTVANPAKCDGTQYNPLEKDCCGSSIFSLANQRCQNSVVETKCGNNWYDANANLRCENNIIETKCGSGWYDATNTNLRCESNVIETKCGTNGWYDAANTNLRCENDIVEALCWTNWYNSKTLSCSNGTLFMTDSRDNQTYNIVTIGTQTWMAQNLNYNVSGSRCYNNSADNCTTYGRLYSDATAWNVCPSGWHLPSNAEWGKLLYFVNPDCPYNTPQGHCGNSVCANAGTKLKAKNGWETGKAGTDDYGFSALPGGRGTTLSSNIFWDIGTHGEWWSASWSEGGTQCVRRMYYGEDYVSYGASGNMLSSVRCLQD